MKKFLPLLTGLVLGAALTWFVLHRPAADQPGEKAPTLDITAGSAALTKQIESLGLATATPGSVELTPEAKGYGRVLDPAPFIAAVAEVAAARAAAMGSGREHARLKGLHDEGENASAQAVETAEAAWLRDRVQLAAAEARLLAGWGRALAEKPDLDALVHTLASGEAALVRIDLLPGEAPAAPPATARVAPLTGEGAGSEVELLGPAPFVDVQVQGTGYLALWRNAPLPAGMALRATLALPGEPRKVLLLPRSSLVRHEGAVFVYVQTGKGGFERRIVTLGPALADGVVITDGVAAEDKVVVTGAQQLLATELLGSAGGGDD